MDVVKTDEEKRRFAEEIKSWVAKQVNSILPFERLENVLMDIFVGQVANHKQLRGGVVFVDTIPKSAAGKILRRELRLRAAKERAEEEKAMKRQAKL